MQKAAHRDFLSAAMLSVQLGGDELALSNSAQVPLMYLRLFHSNAELFLKYLYLP